AAFPAISVRHSTTAERRWTRITRPRMLDSSSRVKRTPLRHLAPVLFVIAFACVETATLIGQSQVATIRIHVHTAGTPIEKADVVVGGITHQTDSTGTVQIEVAPGDVDMTVVKSGYVSTTANVHVTAGAPQDVTVNLQAEPTLEETVTVVATTRTDKRLEDQPMRVEVLAREEIEEKMLMTTGDIVMMLNEMGGMRVQATSPSL